uniref:Uncharacterized protein n=1 Tax=Panagrolaimus sp. PS1159 TaxID=55785 RepID=A0AC35FIG8_9BILA
MRASKYLYQSLEIQGTVEKNLKPLLKLYIINRLEIEYSNNFLLHKIIPKLHKCDARFIKIFQQVITFKEFEFLVDPLRIEKLYFDNGGITNIFDENVADLKPILDRLPNAYNIEIQFNQKFEISPITFSKLTRNVKIQSLSLNHFNALLNLEDFCNFILKNASSPNAEFWLGFNDKNVTPEKAETFDKAVNEFTI